MKEGPDEDFANKEQICRTRNAREQTCAGDYKTFRDLLVEYMGGGNN